MIHDLYVLFRGLCTSPVVIIVIIGVVIAILNPHIEFKIWWGEKKDENETHK